MRYILAKRVKKTLSVYSAWKWGKDAPGERCEVRLRSGWRKRDGNIPRYWKHILCRKWVNSRFFQNREIRITHHSMEARSHRRRGGIGISTSHSVTFKLETLHLKRKGRKRHTIKNVSILSSNLLCVLLTSKMEAYPPVSTRQYFSIAWNIFQP